MITWVGRFIPLHKIASAANFERKPREWCSRDRYEFLSDEFDDDAASNTDGEVCNDPSDEELLVKFDRQQSDLKRVAERKKLHRKAWHTVDVNNEIQYLGGGGQQPEINNLTG